MSFLRACNGTVLHQVRNLVRVATGSPLTTVPLGSMTLGRDDVAIVRHWLRDREQWTNSDVVRAYESAFATWNGSLAAYSFLGGRVALSAAIYALDLRPGDEVIVPGYTCVVVPNAFRYAGVNPVYCDIELDTWGPDVSSLCEQLTPRTRAVVIQHLYGVVCRDYDAILDLAQRRGLRVIEDCAHATGAVYRGEKVGNRGDIGFYSSEQSKVFNTGQGGLAVTNDASLAKRLMEFQRLAPTPDDQRTERLLYTVLLGYYASKDPQRWWRSDWANLLYGSRRLVSTGRDEEEGVRPTHYGLCMPAPLAAVGLNQLGKIDALNENRRQTAQLWDQWCIDNGYRPAQAIPSSIPVFLRYPVMVEPERKANTKWAARELKVDLGVWFVSQIHPIAGGIPGCPNATRAVRECINFPTLMI